MDEEVTYIAANGHKMVTDQESYDRGTFWNAQHSADCPCVDDAPPDW
jgi:hypothetical protein